MSTNWLNDIEQLHAFLSGLSFRDADGRELDPDEGFARWRDLTLELRGLKGTIFFIGNGASASMASHFAADMAKNAQLHTQVFSDLALITAISNDMSFNMVFAEPLHRRGREGDMLVVISSSGKSPNILKAVEVARDLKLTIVTLSAMNPDNPLRSAGVLNAYVGAQVYGYAESCHAAILHHWMDLVEGTA